MVRSARRARLEPRTAPMQRNFCPASLLTPSHPTPAAAPRPPQLSIADQPNRHPKHPRKSAGSVISIWAGQRRIESGQLVRDRGAQRRQVIPERRPHIGRGNVLVPSHLWLPSRLYRGGFLHERNAPPYPTWTPFSRPGSSNHHVLLHGRLLCAGGRRCTARPGSRPANPRGVPAGMVDGRLDGDRGSSRYRGRCHGREPRAAGLRAGQYRNGGPDLGPDKTGETGAKWAARQGQSTNPAGLRAGHFANCGGLMSGRNA